MAKKISQLTQATQIKSDDVTVIVQDGETKKLPLNMMVTKQDIENKKVAGLAKLDEIEATYENDTYTPTIAVKNKSSVKVGEGDGVDYSANVMDGPAKSAILSGNTGYRDIDTGEFLETFEEGRNLELVSVKMPVLKTTGKNLFDGEFILGKINDDGTNSETKSMARSKNYIEVKPNTTYNYKWIQMLGASRIFFYDNNKQFISKGDSIPNSGGNFTTPNNCKYIHFHLGHANNFGSDTVQIEQGKQATSYEPHKSNTLSTPEDVVLRGIGDVKDELDCLTGEVIERIVEFNFNQNYVNSVLSQVSELESVYRFSIGKIDGLNNNYVNKSICDRFKIANDYTGNYEHTYYWNGVFYFFIEKSKIEGTVDAFRTYITNNPIKFQTVLATPTTKTVDLIPSGTHPSTTPYCWKDGHIQLSSSGLLPSLEYSVVTSRAGQISQNAAMIVKNDKRIFDLEILLAGGLVNTTYQALTLQNQVETGLSKVSLNSETEPDYLLYHMIMKLIEEKAYKLDDLAEKVSVFYLYEKLSDEQFETIYAALYPFVEDEYDESDIPGDDEVIEEPIVDESLEEVEDEVVM